MKKKLLLLLVFTVNTISLSQNNSLDFDGVNDFVDVPNSANVLANATAISMSCQVYPKANNLAFPLFNGIAGYRNESNFDFYLIQLSSNEVEARFRNSNGIAYSITYNGLVLNQWNHFFLVYNGLTLKLYKGTLEVGSVAASGSVPASNSSAFKIGLIPFQNFNWYHNGYIDEVSLWRRALTVPEIGAIISNNGIANPAGEASLSLYYKFNQGIPYGNNTGLTSLIDAKNTANGTLTNFALIGNSSNWRDGAPLSINSFDENKTLVYPNPTSTVLNFSTLAAIENIKIIDLYGRVIIDKNIEPTNEPTIEVKQLQVGTYIAIINNTIKVKFLKN